MPDVLCDVHGCARPVPDSAFVCPSCAYLLDAALGEVIGNEDVAGLAEDLDVTLTKQDRIGLRSERRSTELPLPFSVNASEAGYVLRSTLAGWVRIVAEETGAEMPADTLAAMAVWLRPRVGWLRHHKAGADAVDEITDAVEKVRRAVDRPPELWYAGPCGAAVDSGRDCSCSCHIGGAYRSACDVEGGCEHVVGTCENELYAHVGAYNVICRECGASYDVAERRQWLLKAAEDVLATGPMIARALTRMGDELKEDRIRQWASRGHIVSHGRDQQGKPLYRIGDVIERLMDPKERKRAS